MQVDGVSKRFAHSVKGEIYAASADSFFTTNGLSIVFTRDSSGRAVKMKMGQIEGIRKQ